MSDENKLTQIQGPMPFPEPRPGSPEYGRVEPREGTPLEWALSNAERETGYPWTPGQQPKTLRVLAAEVRRLQAKLDRIARLPEHWRAYNGPDGPFRNNLGQALHCANDVEIRLRDD